MEIFKLFGSILINTDEADNSLAKTDSKAKSFSERLGSGIKTAAKWGAAIVGAAGTAAAGMYKMATGAAETADEIDKMSQKIGVSREGYQELSFALSQSGSDISKLQGGLKTLSQQAEKGNKYFEELGISLVDVNGKAKDQETLFTEVVGALQNMEAGTEKTTIATQLLGKAGTDLMPLLNSEAGSLESLRQEARDLGLVLENDVVNSGVNLTDSIDKMKRSLSAIMTQLGGRLMPIVQKAVDFITANTPKINELIGKIAPLLEDAFDKILPTLMDLASDLLPQIVEVVSALLPPISRILQAITPLISQLVQKLAPVIMKLIEKLLPPLVDILDALTPVLDVIFELLDPILDLVLALIDPIADILKLLAPLIKLALSVITAVLEPIMPLIQGLTELLGDVLGGAITAVAGYVGGLLEAFQGFMTFLSGDFDKGIQLAAQGFMDAFSSALGFVDQLFGTNLQQWYNDVTAFWKDAGGKLYEVLHADEIAATAESIEVTEMKRDIVQTSNEYMRQGMSAADALAKAKDEILTTSEKLAMFNANLADEITEEEARQRQAELRATGQIHANFNAADYYSSHYNTPHLASGGIVHGKTLAVVGDNANVRSDPEVVAPLSELQEKMNMTAVLAELKTMNGLLKQMLSSPGVINVDGQRLASIVTNKININRYTKGAEVVYT